jgi:hypothetical protein
LFDHALNAGDEATCFRVAYVDVSDAAHFETPVDGCFYFIRRGPLAVQNQPVVTIGLKREGQLSQPFGKCVDTGEYFAAISMNKDRAWRGVGIESCEWIVGEKDSVFLAHAKLLQTGAAWTITGSSLNMGGVPVLRRFESAASLLGDDGIYRDCAKSGHVFLRSVM